MHISSQFASARLLLLVDLCRLFPTHLARADTGSPLVQLHELHELFLLGRLLWIQVALTSLDSFFAHMFSFSLFSPMVALLLFCRESLSPAGSNSHTALALPLTTLDQALIVVFKEAFPLARDQEKREPASLDATGVQLDHAYLVKADLKQMWGPQASLRRANLSEANLSEVTLFGATLFGANLRGADLSATDLSATDLSGAILMAADLRWAILFGTTLSGAYLMAADLREAKLRGAKLIQANLSGATLNRTDLRGAEGLTKEQRAVYKALGALVDEEPVSNVSQEPVLPSPPLEPESVQPPSLQETSPTPDAGRGNGMPFQSAPGQGTSEEAEKGDDVGRTP